MTNASIDTMAVTVRQISADDGEALERFHESLSSETTRLRFFVTHPHLMRAEVDRFVHVDHHDREALVAISDGDIVAVARFDRLPGTTGAEVAFVVADAWQGLGLGTRLYAALADRARREGIQQLIAETLGDNRRMLAVFHHTGRVVRTSIDAGVIRLVLDIEPEVA